MILTISPKQETPEEQIEPLAVNSKQAARLLGVSERTIFNLTRDGKISCKKVGWRSLYSVASLRAFLESPDKEELREPLKIHFFDTQTDSIRP